MIGILVSIVLVSFPSADNKAKDARMVLAMSQMRSSMIFYQSTNGSYAGFSCNNPVDIANLCAEVAAKDYNKAPVVLKVSVGAVCAYAPLNVKKGASYYCVDSAGEAGTTEINPGTTCNDTTFTCPTNMAR